MRGKKAKKRDLKPDIKYKSVVVTKLINYVMQDGKKNKSANNVYKALEEAGKQLKKEPIEVFDLAIKNVSPQVEVKSRRVGGSNYQVPVPVKDDRQLTLGLRWLIAAARDGRGSGTFAESLAGQIVAAANKEGTAYKKKEDTHKMAEANRAFAHFSW